jgi:predicted dehydrogenase
VTRLDVAVVGLGIGAAHIEEGYLPNADRFRVAAVCALDPAHVAAAADRYDVRGRFTDFDALLAAPGIDVIDVCTPPALHLPMAVAALAAGKHVILEKPVCAALAEVDRLDAAAAAAPGRLMPVFQYRFGDGVEQARAVVAAGIAGRPYVATAETLWRRTPEYYAVPWRGRWETELGGVLISQAIHIHDLATHVMGPVTRVFGRAATRVNAIEVEDCVSASCLLASGALLSLTASLGGQDEISRLRFVFEHVTFESDHAPYNPGAAPWRILTASDATQRRIDDLLAGWLPRPSRFEAQMARYHDAVTTGGPLPVTLADARAALELAAAIYHSSATGTDVPLPLGPDHPVYHSWVPRGRSGHHMR